MLRNRIPLATEFMGLAIPAQSEAEIIGNYEGGKLIEFSRWPGIFRLPLHQAHLFEQVDSTAPTFQPVNIDEIIREALDG